MSAQEVAMRTFVAATLILMSASLLIAQQQIGAPSPEAQMRRFLSSSDVAGFVAKAKAERQADQANFVQPLFQLLPYTVNLEYRVAKLTPTASVHETEAELFYVIDGSGTMVTGGKLTGESRTNAQNLTGTGIEGGNSRRIAKGDVMMVPEGTPHWFPQVENTLVLMSLHLPRAAH
jgi:mannose-6-phosphate isomerase-like protein (cupin superfamily)